MRVMKFSSVFRCLTVAGLGLATVCAFADGDFATGVSNFTYVDGSSYGLNTADPLPTLGTADFAAAASGASAEALYDDWRYVQNNTLWANPSAIWIGSSYFGDYSDLFAVAVTTGSYADAYLNVELSADDQLGDPNNAAGIFLDGSPLAGTITGVLWDDTIYEESIDLGALSAGTHYIYFDVWNSGDDDACLIAAGNITGSPTIVTPSPAAVIPFALGALGAWRRRVKGR
jgi:hypothetical protein